MKMKIERSKGMRFVETELLKVKRHNNELVTEITEMLTEFLKVGIPVAEIKDWQEIYETPRKCVMGLYYAINRSSFAIKVKQRGEHIFITRADA